MRKIYSKIMAGALLVTGISLGTLSAQVIDYRISYNASTDQYEVYGRATATLVNINLGGSQLGIVMPAAAPNVNFTVTTVNGGVWVDGNATYAPAAQPGSDFHAISTTGSTFSMPANTEMQLFAFSTGGPCVAGARMYLNGVDPSPFDPGMSGNDFSNVLVDALSLNDYTGVPYSNGGTICAPLAARLLSFTGQRSGGHVLLNWSVADEKELAAYQLQRGMDGRNWSVVGTVAPGHKNAGTASYSYSDAWPGEQPQVYYRLELKNQDGSSAYSDVLRLKKDGDHTAGFTVQPNPVQAGADFVLNSEKHAAGALVVLSSTGQLLFRKTYQQDEPMRVGTAGWAPGIYFVRWEGSDGGQAATRLSVL